MKARLHPRLLPSFPWLQPHEVVLSNQRDVNSVESFAALAPIVLVPASSKLSQQLATPSKKRLRGGSPDYELLVCRREFDTAKAKMTPIGLAGRDASLLAFVDGDGVAHAPMDSSFAKDGSAEASSDALVSTKPSHSSLPRAPVTTPVGGAPLAPRAATARAPSAPGADGVVSPLSAGHDASARGDVRAPSNTEVRAGHSDSTSVNGQGLADASRERFARFVVGPHLGEPDRKSSVSTEPADAEGAGADSRESVAAAKVPGGPRSGTEAAAGNTQQQHRTRAPPQAALRALAPDAGPGSRGDSARTSSDAASRWTGSRPAEPLWSAGQLGRLPEPPALPLRFDMPRRTAARFPAKCEVEPESRPQASRVGGGYQFPAGAERAPPTKTVLEPRWEPDCWKHGWPALDSFVSAARKATVFAHVGLRCGAPHPGRRARTFPCVVVSVAGLPVAGKVVLSTTGVPAGEPVDVVAPPKPGAGARGSDSVIVLFADRHTPDAVPLSSIELHGQYQTVSPERALEALRTEAGDAQRAMAVVARLHTTRLADRGVSLLPGAADAMLATASALAQALPGSSEAGVVGHAAAGPGERPAAGLAGQTVLSEASVVDSVAVSLATCTGTAIACQASGGPSLGLQLHQRLVAALRVLPPGWTEADGLGFARGFTRFGKQFHQVAAKCPGKSTLRVVEHYYWLMNARSSGDAPDAAMLDAAVEASRRQSAEEGSGAAPHRTGTPSSAGEASADGGGRRDGPNEPVVEPGVGSDDDASDCDDAGDDAGDDEGDEQSRSRSAGNGSSAGDGQQSPRSDTADHTGDDGEAGDAGGDGDDDRDDTDDDGLDDKAGASRLVRGAGRPSSQQSALSAQSAHPRDGVEPAPPSGVAVASASLKAEPMDGPVTSHSAASALSSAPKPAVAVPSLALADPILGAAAAGSAGSASSPAGASASNPDAAAAGRRRQPRRRVRSSARSPLESATEAAQSGLRWCSCCHAVRPAVRMCANLRCCRTMCEKCFRARVTALKKPCKASWSLACQNNWWLCFDCCPPFPDAADVRTGLHCIDGLAEYALFCAQELGDEEERAGARPQSRLVAAPGGPDGLGTSKGQAGPAEGSAGLRPAELAVLQLGKEIETLYATKAPSRTARAFDDASIAASRQRRRAKAPERFVAGGSARSGRQARGQAKGRFAGGTLAEAKAESLREAARVRAAKREREGGAAEGTASKRPTPQGPPGFVAPGSGVPARPWARTPSAASAPFAFPGPQPARNAVPVYPSDYPQLAASQFPTPGESGTAAYCTSPGYLGYSWEAAAFGLPSHIGAAGVYGLGHEDVYRMALERQRLALQAAESAASRAAMQAFDPSFYGYDNRRAQHRPPPAATPLRGPQAPAPATPAPGAANFIDSVRWTYRSTPVVYATLVRHLDAFQRKEMGPETLVRNILSLLREAPDTLLQQLGGFVPEHLRFLVEDALRTRRGA